MIKYAAHATADDKVLCACNYCKPFLMATHPHAPPLQATPMHKHFTAHKHSEHSATHLQALLQPLQAVSLDPRPQPIQLDLAMHEHIHLCHPQLSTYSLIW